MNTGYPKPINDNEGDREAAPKIVRRTSVRGHPKRPAGTHTVLGKVRISKAKPQRSNKYAASQKSRLQN